MKFSAIVLGLFLFIAPVSASELQLQTIGAAGGSNLFLTYMSIGVIADAYQKDTYTAEKAAKYVNSITAQAKVVSRYLDKLLASGELSENDSRYVTRMNQAYSLLVKEGDAFVAYVKTRDRKHIKQFHSYRKEAWSMISALLGIGKKQASGGDWQ